MILARLAPAAALAAALAATSTGAFAYDLYNALGGAENGGDSLAAAGPSLGDIFVTGDHAVALSAVTLNLELGYPATDGFQVDLVQVTPPLVAGSPTPNPAGTVYTIATVADATLSNSFQTYVYAPAATITLNANASYLVGIFDYNGDSAAVLGNTVDPAVLGRPSVAAGGYYFNNGGVQANSGGPYEIAVTVVPEPAAWALMLVGFGALGALARRARRPAMA